MIDLDIFVNEVQFINALFLIEVADDEHPIKAFFLIKVIKKGIFCNLY